MHQESLTLEGEHVPGSRPQPMAPSQVVRRMWGYRLRSFYLDRAVSRRQGTVTPGGLWSMPHSNHHASHNCHHLGTCSDSDAPDVHQHFPPQRGSSTRFLHPHRALPARHGQAETGMNTEPNLDLRDRSPVGALPSTQSDTGSDPRSTGSGPLPSMSADFYAEKTPTSDSQGAKRSNAPLGCQPAIQQPSAVMECVPTGARVLVGELHEDGREGFLQDDDAEVTPQHSRRVSTAHTQDAESRNPCM